MKYIHFLVILSPPTSSRSLGDAGRFLHRLFDDLQKRLSFFSQGAVTRVDNVDAPAQGFGVKKFHGDEFSCSQFLTYCQLRKESHAQAAIDHTLGGLDRVNF